jgi:hypothetical protein
METTGTGVIARTENAGNAKSRTAGTAKSRTVAIETGAE